jgi:hypothetical protein
LSTTPFVGLNQAAFNLLQSLFLSGIDKEPEFLRMQAMITVEGSTFQSQ